MRVITIQQLDENGNVYRQFVRHVHSWEIEDALASIYRAYNMARTRVICEP